MRSEEWIRKMVSELEDFLKNFQGDRKVVAFRNAAFEVDILLAVLGEEGG